MNTFYDQDIQKVISKKVNKSASDTNYNQTKNNKHLKIGVYLYNVSRATSMWSGKVFVMAGDSLRITEKNYKLA